MKTHAGLALALILLPLPALAQRDATVPDPDPEVERNALRVLDGFEVSLFAADPLLAKPIQINFDARGRLWVASSEVYPQLAPGQEADDKILVLEDADGDGKAEKTTVFADGLLIPTGVEPGDGGAYVANSTELVFLRDTDGDRKADAREILLSGFGTEDTHHIIHTFRWGPEQLLYFNQSIYIHSHLETPWGPRTLNGGGIWQFRPDSRRLEVVMRGLVNPWGHAFDRWGAEFATDGAGGEGINYVVPGAYYVTSPGAARILPGLNPGSPKHCGLEILSGRAWPDELQGVQVTSDFRANRVCLFRVTEDGSGFASRELPELIGTDFRAFRPIDAKLGPDGALYVADWYNPIIQHGEVDFRDPRRDKVHGRIWRVTAKGRPLVERPKLVDMSTPELLDQLKSPEGWTRQFAKRVLKERGAAEVLPALATWIDGLDANDPDREHRRLEALWLHLALDTPDAGLLSALLTSPEPQARAAAVRVAPHWKDRIPDLMDQLGRLAADPHPRVRLEAVRSLGQFADAKALPLALQALDYPVDRWLDYALWLTCRDLQPYWVPALQAGTLGLDDAKKLTFALQAAGSPEVVEPLLAAIEAGQVAAARLPDVFRLIGAIGTPVHIARAIGLARVSEGADSLRALADAASPRGLELASLPGPSEVIAATLRDDVPPTRLAGLAAVGAFRLEPLRGTVRELAADADQPEPVRLEAVATLARLGGPESVEALDAIAGADAPAPVRRGAVAGLAGLDPKAAAARAAELLERGTPDDLAPLFAAFVNRKEAPEALAAALADRTLPRDAAKLGLRLAKGAGRPSQPLIDALTKAGGLDAPNPLPSPEELEALAAEVMAQGDPARGEALFRRAELQCLNCHAVAGAGGQVGPGLESIGASAQVDYLIASLLEPNKAVKEGYHSVVVATEDGRVLTGIVVLRTEDTLVLRDADGHETRLSVASIEEERPGQSLMPEGLTESLTRPEFVDLVRFLAALGKPGDYAVGPRRLVRRWEVLQPSEEATRFLHRVGLDAAIAADDSPLNWTPAYSNVSGALPMADVPVVPGLPGTGSPTRRWARFAVDVTEGGAASFVLADPEGIEAWADGCRVDLGSPINLDPGRHAITLAIDPGRPSPDLTVELADPPAGAEGAATLQPVLGR